MLRAWGDGSLVKSVSGCSCRGPSVNSQYPHGGSGLSNSSSGDLMASSDLRGHQARTWYTYMNADKRLLLHIK